MHQTANSQNVHFDTIYKHNNTTSFRVLEIFFRPMTQPHPLKVLLKISTQPTGRPNPWTELCSSSSTCITTGWRRGVMVSGVRSMNEVNARRARLVPGWVTVFGRVYHLGM